MAASKRLTKSSKLSLCRHSPPTSLSRSRALSTLASSPLLTNSRAKLPLVDNVGYEEVDQDSRFYEQCYNHDLQHWLPLILDTLTNTHDTKEVVYDIMKKQVVDLARQTFRPEFMNRIDEYIVFKPLDAGEISNIVEIQMSRLKERLKRKKIELHYTKEAIDVLARLGFDRNFGARPVKRVIQQLVENEIAMGVLRGDFKEDEAVLVDADVNSDLPPHKRLRMRKLQSDSSIEAMVANN